MTRSYLILCMLVFVFVLSICGSARATDTDAPDERGLAALECIAKQSARVKKLESRFTQTRFISFLDDKLVSEGMFIYIAPDALIWQYDTPMFFRLEYKNGHALFLHKEPGSSATEPQADSREKELAAQVGRQILMWISLDMKTIRKSYTVTLISESPLQLRLTPKKANQLIRDMELQFDGHGPDVRQIVFIEAEGDRLEITFHDSVRSE